MSGLRSIDIENPAWLASWDPRLRVAAVPLVTVVILSIDRPLPLLIALSAALALVFAAGMACRTLLLRLIPLELFLLLLLFTLPFAIHDGGNLIHVGPLGASWAGIERVVVVALKANVVALVMFALVGTMSPAALSAALAGLHLPAKLVQLLQLSVRYLAVLQREYRRLRRAMKARAFVVERSWHTLRSLGWLIGMLLVRSLERAERVMAAMKCRGFDGELRLAAQIPAWQRADTGRGLLLLAALLVLLAVDRL